VRHPETGQFIHIPGSAAYTVKRNATGPGYNVTISCSKTMSGASRTTLGATTRGTAMGGCKILVRIARLGPIAGRLVAQLAGRAVSGAAAMVLFPEALSSGVSVAGAYNGNSILYHVIT
jgi:hypothetical protein